MSTRRPGGLWGHQDFLKLWAGQTISQFGSQITILALPLVAAALLNASPLEMGILSAAEMAPFLLIGLPAGVWVDRRSRRPILIMGDLGRALVLATIPIAYLWGTLAMPHLYAVGFLTGLLTVFFDVAYMAYLPALIERDQLVEGNSKLEVSRAGAQIAGPGIAGTLIELLSAPMAILFDALSFVASAAFIGGIRRPEPPIAPPAGGATNGMRAQIGEGLRYVLGHPLLRPIACTTATSNLFSSASWALYILFAVRELGLEAATIGIIFAIGNVGFLIGAVLAGAAARYLGLGMALVASTVVDALGRLLIPLAAPDAALPLLIVGGLLMGLSSPVYNINQVSLRQAITPSHLQGRMNATIRFLVWGTMPVGALLGGTLGQLAGLRPALLLAAGGGLLAFLWLLCSPVRALREQPAPVES